METQTTNGNGVTPPHDPLTGELFPETLVRVPKLASALVKAQGEIQDPKTDATNEHFDSSYVSLAAVCAEVRRAFSKHDLCFIQDVDSDGTWVTCWTIVMHGASGEAYRSKPFRAKATQPNVQGQGSATTYVRRYSLMGIAGIAPKDDDGNAASHSNGNGQSFSREGLKQESQRRANGAAVIPYPVGKTTKGTPVSQAPTPDLELLAKNLETALANPEKAKFKASNETLLAAVKAELEKRDTPA